MMQKHAIVFQCNNMQSQVTAFVKNMPRPGTFNAGSTYSEYPLDPLIHSHFSSHLWSHVRASLGRRLSLGP